MKLNNGIPIQSQRILRGRGKGAGKKTKRRLYKSLSDQQVWSGEYVLHMCLVIMEHQLTTISCVLDHFSMVLVTHG